MKTMTSFVLTVTLALSNLLAGSFALAQPWDGPFGLRMGLTVDELKKVIPDLTAQFGITYAFEKAPKHYPGTDLYFVRIGSGDVGLCSITAIAFVDSSNFGDAVRTRFLKTREELSNKYGEPTSVYDFLRPGSLWNRPRDWMMGLAKGDRTLSSFWIKKDDKKKQLNLSPEINNIALQAFGRSSSRAAIHLIYEFNNFDACQNETDKNRLDAL